MSKNKDVLFRSAVNGFNKEDVIAYIAQLNSELEKSSNKLTSALSEVEKLNNALIEEKGKTADAMAKADELKEKLDKQEAVISAQYENMDKIKEEVQRRTEAQAPAEEVPSTYAEKAEMYDKMSAQIGDLIISAKKDADEIVEKSVNDANAMIENVKSQISENAEKVNKNITSELYSETNECYREATDYMNYLQSEINRLLNDFVGKNKQMNDRIHETHSSLSDKLEKEISDFKEKSSEKSINLYLDITDENNKKEV